MLLPRTPLPHAKGPFHITRQTQKPIQLCVTQSFPNNFFSIKDRPAQNHPGILLLTSFRPSVPRRYLGNADFSPNSFLLVDFTYLLKGR